MTAYILWHKLIKTCLFCLQNCIWTQRNKIFHGFRQGENGKQSVTRSIQRNFVYPLTVLFTHEKPLQVSSRRSDKSVKSQTLKTCCIFTGNLTHTAIWDPSRKAHQNWTGHPKSSDYFLTRMKFLLQSCFSTLDPSKKLPKRTSLQASKTRPFYMWQAKSMKDLKIIISIFN